jgi:hypothetical protein
LIQVILDAMSGIDLLQQEPRGNFSWFLKTHVLIMLGIHRDARLLDSTL